MNSRAGKIKRILYSDWLLEWARWAHLARSGFPAVVPQEKIIFLEGKKRELRFVFFWTGKIRSSSSESPCTLSYRLVVVLTGVDKKKRKPYQHDSEAMELVLRLLDRKQGAVNREYWGECFSATLLQSVGEKRDKKENKMITSYNCQAITVSFLRTKKRDARAKWLF